jgi:hypothetical protein
MEFVKTPQGLVFAVKISEWELATLQGGSGGFIEASVPTKQYRQQMSVIPGENSQASVLNPERKGLQKLFNFTPITRTFGERGLWRDTREEAQMREAEKRFGKRPLREADRSIIQDVLFRNERGELVRDSKAPLEYNLGNLTDLQQQYLLRKGKIVKDSTGALRPVKFEDKPPSSGEPANPAATIEKEYVRARLEAITKARVDFYEKTGRDRSSIPINTILSNGTYADRRDSKYLKVEHGAKTNIVPDFRIELNNQMNFLMKDVKKTVSEKVKKEKLDAEAAKEKGAVTDAKTAVEAQIKSLDESTMSDEDKEKEQKKIDADIKEVKGRKEALKKLEKLDEDRKQTQKELDDVNLELDATKIGPLETAEGDLKSAVTDVTQLKVNIEDRRARIIAITNAFAGKSLTPATQTALTTELTGLQTDQKTDLTTLATRSKDVETHTGTVATLEQDLNPGYTREQNRANLKRSRELDSQKKRQDYQHGALEARLKLDAKNVIPGTANLHPSSHFESEETRLTKEKAEVGNPDEARVLKKEVLTTYKDEVIDKYPAVMGRVKQYEDKKDPVHDALVHQMEQQAVYYADHPLVYVQTLKLIFGPDVALPGADNAAKFQKAANLITPELFLEELKKAYPTDPMVMAITDPHDALLKHPDLVDKVGSKLTRFLFKRLSAEASQGTLSDMNPAVKAQVDSLKPITASVIPFTETEISAIRDEAYYFRNTEDLTRQILDRWSTISGTNKWLVPTELQAARAYAEEIIKRKNTEVKS